MKELITLQQANTLMLIVLVAAPFAGALWGYFAKQLKSGALWGLAIGVGNLALWRIYNGITDRLGLDTVKNLLVNLGLFILIGLVIGVAIGRLSKPSKEAEAK
jgi:DMSO/TMAO reductase YedYZ heme-binding membrane subunit